LRAVQQQIRIAIHTCTPETAVTECRDNVIDLVLMHMPEPHSQAAIDLLQRLGRRAPIILICESNETDLATTIVAHLKRYITAGPSAPHGENSNGPKRLLGESEPMRKLRNYVTRVARSDCNVLITGETGTGKELVAHMIHHESVRSTKAFVCVNCAAIPDALFESELFGHERGAFTGASCARDGRMRQADGGTLFLDEIGEMTPMVQAKLLRAIETKELQRIGARNRSTVDIRIVAATNQDLQTLVAAGGFRKDLYFRLNVARVSLPPLRARREDIPLLLEAHLLHLNRHQGTNVRGFSDAAMRILCAYDWPGNVRELKNALEATLLNVRSQWIEIEDLPEELRGSLQLGQLLPEEDDIDRRRVIDTLQVCRWNKAQAARQLQWSRMTLYRKMAKYQIVESALEPNRSSNEAAAVGSVEAVELFRNVS
jgi:two-component system response regulator HydG/two-component system response regulator AtoC